VFVDAALEVLLMNLRETMALLGSPEQPAMKDYRIEEGGTLVRMLSERSTQRAVGPKPKVGWSVAFKSKYETAEFVNAGETEGFTFEGKELLAGML
jgi:hypothetical protein